MTLLWLGERGSQSVNNLLDSGDFPNLLAAIRYARSLGSDVYWINFDADADVVLDLPTYDW